MFPTQAATRSGLLTHRELPTELLPLLRKALEEAESWLARNQPASFREDLLDLYFTLHSFLRTADLYDECFVTIIEPGVSTRVRLFCLDPSFLTSRQALERGKTAVFFSATAHPNRLLLFTPRWRLRGSAAAVALPRLPRRNWPFSCKIASAPTSRAREETLTAVAHAIGALVQERRGNYLVYLPSHQYLQTLQEEFQALHPNIRLRIQQPAMTESEREAFLTAFGLRE